MGASIRSSGALILVEMCHSIGNGFHKDCGTHQRV